jgi:MFS transporter, ACS family, 4-hydroxyphenylacetate permease
MEETVQTRDEGIATPESLEEQTVSRVFRRLMWFLILLSIAMSLDRTNIGFAALQMNKQLGLTASQFGLAVGIVSFGYIVSEIPSNLLFVKYGARIWLPRIAITWGIISAGTMFAQGPHSLYALRFILGLAEGGFLPGVILYLSYWLPQKARARGLGLFLMAQALAFITNPLVSGPLLDMQGTLGLAGWQWLFLLEGLPSVILGIVAYFYLTNRPADATWLDAREKAALAAAIARDPSSKPSGTSTWRELCSTKMALLLVAYFGVPSSVISYVSWSPQIVRALAPHGSSFVYTGLLNAIPAVCCAIAMPLWSAHSDKMQERRWHTILPLLVAIAGWLIVASSLSPALSLIGLCMSLSGTFTAQGVYFALATEQLSPSARPVGIATISTISLVSTLISPPLTGYLKDLTGSLSPGLYFVGFLLAVGAGVLMIWKWKPVAPAINLVEVP